MGTIFRRNTTIRKYNELFYFTSLTNIQTEAFNGCSNLSEIMTPEGVVSIGSSVFAGCTSLMNVRISENISSLPSLMFSGCNNLKRINSNVDGVFDLPNVKTLGTSAFHGCSQVEDITISSEAASFGTHVFNNCTKLKRLNSETDGVYNLPLGQKTITENMFGSCPVEILNMATDITSIGGSAFVDCTKLRRINSTTDGVFNIPDTVTNIGSMAFRRTLCYDFHIPTGLRTLGYSAFNSSKLSGNIVLPEGITTLNINTFDSTLITSCDIPSTVTSIGNQCFRVCSNLTSVIVRATTPPTLGTNVLNGANNAVIYVPSASVGIYKTANNWSAYASKIQAIPE